MAIAFTARAFLGATATFVTTAAFTPSANSRLFAISGGRTTAAVPPTITDSLSGSWTLLTGSNIDFTNVAGSIYYQDIGASPGSMTVTSTSGGTQAGVMCFDVTGHSNDLSNFQVGTNSAGDPSVTLASMAANSIGVAAFIGNAGGAATGLPAGYSSVYNGAPATNLRMALYTDLTSPGAAQAWVTPSTDSIAFGFEIKEAAAGGGGTNLKVWDGSAWVTGKPVKVWNGSAWVTKPLKRWDGAAWV